MARINFYEFPKTVDSNTRFQNGAIHSAGHCTLGREDCRGCTVCAEGWSECREFCADEAEYVVGGLRVSDVKRLMREYGGIGWTGHCDRTGGCFETTDITLTGNNSKFKYNHHLLEVLS